MRFFGGGIDSNLLILMASLVNVNYQDRHVCHILEHFSFGSVPLKLMFKGVWEIW